MNGIITPTVVISAVGTLVGRYFQDRTERISQFRAERKIVLTAAIEYAVLISKQMDRYLFCAKDVYNGFKYEIDKDDAKLFKKKWDTFVDENTAWESTLNTNVANVSAHFGEDMANIFQEGISNNFVYLRKVLDGLYYHKKDFTFKNLETDKTSGETIFIKTWNSLAQLVQVFNTEMLNLTKTKNVGSLRKYFPGNR